MPSGKNRWLSAVLITLCVGAYAYAHQLTGDSVMRVAGDIISIDPTIGTVTIETSSGPRMTVLPLPDRRGSGVPIESRVGDAVVVEFLRSAAQGRNRRPGTVNATAMTQVPPGFCSCSRPSNEGCGGTCIGTSRIGACRILEGIVYPNVCGVESVR